jgi:hypothetical protein
MNSTKAEALLKKYWNAETNPEEERELKNFLSLEGSSHRNAVYFQYLSSKAEDAPLDHSFDDKILALIRKDPSETKTGSISRSYWYIAASLALVISVSIIFKDRIFQEVAAPPVVQIDTFEDPEKAFEETKKALLFLSSKLNQSGEYATQFSKFEQSQEIIKQN